MDRRCSPYLTLRRSCREIAAGCNLLVNQRVHAPTTRRSYALIDPARELKRRPECNLERMASVVRWIVDFLEAPVEVSSKPGQDLAVSLLLHLTGDPAAAMHAVKPDGCLRVPNEPIDTDKFHRPVSELGARSVQIRRDIGM
jgi:hypothetical protein